VVSFSSASPFVDLAAPGVDIPVAEPMFDDATGFTTASGTSFSSPMVAGAAAWVWTARPELDKTQLLEVMRRSARDIDVRGFDVRSGYGMLDIPAALSLPTPIADPLEPNDDTEEIVPGRLFKAGMPPLTTAQNGSAALTARVERYEDPHDFYRVLVPAGRRVTVTTTGPVDLRVYRRSVRPLKTQPAATSAHPGDGPERASFRNAGPRTVYVYAEVRPGIGVREAEYTLKVTTAARP
jgi:hypothetical protein